MDFPFTKMQGLGNDFIVADDRGCTWDLAPEAIEWLCDRHFGVGADGLILVRPATEPDADFLMAYFNADGSPSEMCGNGVRCFAKWLIDRDLVDGDVVRVQTPGGVREITVTRDETGRMLAACVDMGEPVLAPALVPVALPGERVVDREIDTPAGPARVTAVSMGNPHAILWVDDVDAAPVESLGPAIETAAMFPRRTNVEFAEHVPGSSTVRLRVWERGVGETLACGTGACATAVAAILDRGAVSPVTVELPGGELEVDWAPGAHVLMTGPAAESFSGVVPVPDQD